jgi:hypothetical protein
MRTLLWIALTTFVGAGCAPLMEAQSDLVAQARRGIDVAQENRAGAGTVYEQLAKLKRQRLDEAFDADVRDRERTGDLSSDWVVAHRAAYAAALDAYAKESQTLRASDDVARRNLHAVDAALQRLQWLQSIQNRWLTLPQQVEEQR